MSYLKNNIVDICNNYYRYLLSLQNVSGIGLGFKYINNINTFKYCLHVLVRNKVPSKYITSNNLIPNQYMGISTDVIEVGDARLKSGEAIPQKFRPLQGGCGISLGNDDGTLGCIVTRPYYYFFKEYFILSNNHVLADLNNAPIGSPILQPSINNNGDIKNDIVAHLSDFISLKFTTAKNINNPPINYVDCAIAKISNTNLISNKIYTLGEIKGIGKISLNMPVRKVGFISGLTEGYIITKYVTKFLRVDSKRKLFFQNLILTDLKTSHGDSGSIVVNTSNEVLGLFLGGTDNLAYMQDINTVLSKLNISIYTC